MKQVSKMIFILALVMALSATTYAQAGGSMAGAGTRGIGAGSLRTPHETGYGAGAAADPGVGANAEADGVRSSPTPNRFKSGKSNGLNKGTNSGANSDVNRGIGTGQNGQ